MFLTRFSSLSQRKIDLTKTFKSFLRDDSFKLCSKIAGFLGKQRLGCLGERAQARAGASPKVLLTVASHSSLETLERAMRD